MAPRLAKVPVPGGEACGVDGADVDAIRRRPPARRRRAGRSWSGAPGPETGRRRSRRRCASAQHLDPRRLDPRHFDHPAASVGLRAHAGVLRVASEPDAEEPPAPARLVPLPLEAIVPRQVQRLLEGLREIPAVVHEAAGRRERVGVARNEVPPADLGGIHAQSIGEEIERPLHGEGGERHADPAIRAEGRLVGRDGHALVRVGRRAVRAGQDRGGAEWLERLRQRVDVIGAGVGEQRAPEAPAGRRRRRPPPPAPRGPPAPARRPRSFRGASPST